jgi:hypothetical protein
MKLGWFRRKRDSGIREAEGPSRRAVREQLAREYTAALLRDALERLPELEPERAKVLFHDVVEGFFYEVMDLGASAAYHHASPWGLAQHSLEVAVHALRIARSRHFVGHAAPNPEEQEHRLPRLRYGCFLFALYHDLGKILQASIRGPDRDTHNPFLEPLGAFYDRHGRDECRTQWREGRTLEDHVELTPYLVGHILPRAAAIYIGSVILAEITLEKTAGAREVMEIIAEADQHSVREDRRKAEAKAESAGPSFASGSFVAYLAKSFAEGIKQSRLAVNIFGGDVLVGRRFAFFSYPAAVQKLVSLVKECFGRSDVAARMLGEDESGARFFLAKLKADEGLFTDPGTGLWKLKATIEQEGASDVREGVLIPLAHLGLASGPTESFSGSITFGRPSDGSEVVIDDFRLALSKVEGPPPRAPAVVPSPATPPPDRPPQVAQAGQPPPPPPALAKASEDKPSSPSAPTVPPASPPLKEVPATLGPQAASAPQGGMDPEGLARDLVEGILAGWIPTNVPQAQVYVNPKTTFVATPAVFVKMRERGLYPDFDPQDRSSPYLRSLARLDSVQKSPTHRIVYPIMLGPESERPLKVIKFDTLGLFKSQEVRDRIGLWKDWERIIELPQEWKPGDAVPREEESA